jgi:hypothetical protein
VTTKDDNVWYWTCQTWNWSLRIEYSYEVNFFFFVKIVHSLRNQQTRYVCQKMNFIVVGSHGYFAIIAVARRPFAMQKSCSSKKVSFLILITQSTIYMVNFKFACQHCQSWQPDCSGIKIIQIFIVTTIFRYSWSCGRIHENIQTII